MNIEFLRATVLSVAAIALGAILSCALPFAALAAVASRSLSRRFAYGAVGATVLCDQIAGFSLHHFPHDASTIAWSFAIGFAALAAVAAARAVPSSRFAIAIALAVAFVTQQVAIAGYSAATHELATDTWPVIGAIALANLTGLALFWPLSALITLAARSSRTVEN